MELMTVAEVADYLRISRWSVGRYVAAGELVAIKGPGRNGPIRITRDSLCDYIARHTVKACPVPVTASEEKR